MSALTLHTQDDDGKHRPHWHIDAKWVCGLLLCVVLGIWLLLVVAYRVTERETAVQLMTGMVTVGMDRGTPVENQQAVEKLRKQIQESPTKSIQLLPGFPLAITEADLSLTADELRNKIFRQITEPLYDKGARKLAEEQTADKAQQDKFVNDASALSLLSKENHDRLGTWVLVGGGVVLLVAGLAMFFSHRFGRLVTLGVVLLLASVPGLVVFSVLRSIASQPSAPVSEVQDYYQLAMSAKGALLPAFVAAQQVYIVAILVAVGLLLVAAIGRIVYAIVQKVRHKKPKE